MALVGSFPFNSFLSGVLSCVGTAVLAGKSLRGVCSLILGYRYIKLTPLLISLFDYSVPSHSSEQREQGIQGKFYF